MPGTVMNRLETAMNGSGTAIERQRMIKNVTEGQTEIMIKTESNFFACIIITPDCCQPQVGEKRGSMRFTELDR